MFGGMNKLFKEMIDKLPPDEREAFEERWQEQRQEMFGEISGKMQELATQLTERFSELLDGEADPEDNQDEAAPIPAESAAAAEPARAEAWLMDPEPAEEPSMLPHEAVHALQAAAAEASAKIEVIEAARHEAARDTIESIAVTAEEGEAPIAAQSDGQTADASVEEAPAEEHADAD